MPAKIARGFRTPNQNYVCLYCRLQKSPLVGGRTTRYQHTGLPEYHGGQKNQDSIPKEADSTNPASRSRIEDLIGSLMSKSDAKDREIEGDSRIKSLGKKNISPPIPEPIPSIAPQPNDSADVLQRKLQQKFAAQRRSELLAMQASQASKVAEKNEEVPKARSVPSIKQSPKKSSTRAERAERRRKIEKAALSSKAEKRSKQKQAKSVEIPLNEVAEVTSSTETQEAEGRSTSVKTSAEKGSKTPGMGDKEAINNESKGDVAGKQTATAQKLDDILDVLESLNNIKKPGSPPSVARRVKYTPTDAKPRAAVAATPNELRNNGKMLEAGSLGAEAMFAHAPGLNSLKAALRANLKGAGTKSVQMLPSEKVKKPNASPKPPSEKVKKPKRESKSSIERATASDLEILPLNVDQPPVPKLAHGLERVLFNPGVYQLQDPRSRVYNFDPNLQKVIPVAEFDFNALKEYITSSRDQSLIKIAREHGKRYMGSTSSMTEVLAHFHFLLSQWRHINPSMLSKTFPVNSTNFTEFQRIPSAIFLRWKDGSYAIDADKQFANANVLSMLGKSMEKLLTLSTDDFERYRKSSPSQVTEDEQLAPESYHYSTLGDFLMRSQLDAHDPRLPGTGMFDLKTRSVVSIRMDVGNYEQGVGYEIKTRQGQWESYEREYHDMIRAAFLKYSLQVRMGRMDGIFVAFHNIERIFGFQYISLPEMDSTIHGQWDTSIGDQEFRLSLDLMNKVLDRATKKYPETSLRIHFETRDVQTPFMYMFAEPVTEEQVEEIQSRNSAKIQEFERNILGLKHGNGSETDDTQEDESKWESIQADVQEAMDKDELSVDEPGQDHEPLEGDAEGAGSAPDRPEVLEQGPLYAGKSKTGAGDDATAASAGSEENDGDSEDDDDIDIEEEREDDKEEEDLDGDDGEDRELEENRQQEGLGEFLEDTADIEVNDAVEAEVGGEGPEENDVASSENHPVKVQNDANEGNEDDTPGAISGQKNTHEATESMIDKEDTGISPDGRSSSILEEIQEEYQTEADRGFLDTIDQEVAQADTAAEESSSQDILAMTLTLRNKVNGEYVLRPEKMTAADEWSIEYSLTEVAEQRRARALYEACKWRRSKKIEAPLPEDTEVISGYVQRLREMSERGRAWRREQDKRDRERPVQVL